MHNHQTNRVSLSWGFSGTNAGGFSTGGTCTSTLAAKTVCTLTLTFAPTAVGTEAATMTVSDSPDSFSPYTVSFTALAGGTCESTLAGGSAHCTYTLKFTPSIVGAKSARLGVSATGDSASPHNVSLTGTGS